MKLASMKNGTRDGRLVVVSRDLTRCTDASFLAPTLQAALDDWRRIAPHLAALSESLEHGSVPSGRFHEHDVLSPLPRACEWVDASAYESYVALLHKVHGQATPGASPASPLMHHGGGSFLAPRDPILVDDESWGVDMEGEVAVIVDDVPAGAGLDAARDAIRLVMLVNDVSLRGLASDELAGGFGLFASKPSPAFSPVAVTLDELGNAWDGGRLHLPLRVDLNGKPFGRANAGIGMSFDFPALVAHAARTRALGAGVIIGAGAVSNGHEGKPAAPLAQAGPGYSCIAETRMIEALGQGRPKTGFMRFGDTVRIEMKDEAGHSIFGAIEQTVSKRHVNA